MKQRWTVYIVYLFIKLIEIISDSSHLKVVKWFDIYNNLGIAQFIITRHVILLTKDSLVRSMHLVLQSYTAVVTCVFPTHSQTGRP